MRVSRHEAVVRITQRVRRPDDDERQARNRVSKRIGYAVTIGALKELTPRTFAWSEITRWAREEWPDKFSDWPTQTEVSGSSSVEIGSFADAMVLPGTLARCHTHIEELYDQLEALRSELALVRKERDQLRPDAEEWRQFCLGNKRNAEKPRK